MQKDLSNVGALSILLIQHSREVHFNSSSKKSSRSLAVQGKMADVGRASIRRGGAEYCLMYNVSVHGLKLLFVIFFKMDYVFKV